MKHTTDTITLAKNGRTNYTIVYEFSGDVLLDPAVRDLAATLEEITGAKFPVAPKTSGCGIHVGVAAPGDKDAFASRERRIKSVGEDLYIYGDYRYGVAGAIYNFLREFCGCRWYTATGDKRIPKNPDLRFAAIDYRHVPSFKSIEHGSKDVFSARNPDIRDWVRRNNSFLMPNYAFGAPDDAWNYIGPVTHTLAAYIPPIERKPRSFNADNTFAIASSTKTIASGTYTYDTQTKEIVMKLGKVYSYMTMEGTVTATTGGAQVLFDANKFLAFAKKAIKVVGAGKDNSTLNTIANLAEQVTGLKLGFDMKK